MQRHCCFFVKNCILEMIILAFFSVEKVNSSETGDFNDKARYSIVLNVHQAQWCEGLLELQPPAPVIC